MRALIVDQDPTARERLRQLLRRESDFEIIEPCATEPQTLAAMIAHRPDVLWLDADLPDSGARRVLRKLPADQHPAVVLFTAQDGHTLDVFELGVQDCLFKPYSVARFRQAVTRIREWQAERNGGPRDGADGAGPLKRFIIRVNDRLQIVPAAEIDWMESANNYIVLHAGRDTHVLRDTLSSLERRLPPTQFLRVSRFTILNLDRVRSLCPTKSKHYVVVLADGTEVPVTRSLREVQERLETA